jgi:arginase family enzyme
MILTLYFTTSLGGDHTIVLPILRSLYKVYGPISVIHFDAHLDTWGRWSPQESITHGSFFYIAAEEGLLSNTSVHAGIRCKMTVRLNMITGCNCAYVLTEHVLTGLWFMRRMRLI